MFHKIEKKIVLTMVITISFCMILSSIVTYSIIRKNILNSFISLAIQSAEQQKNNFDLFLDLTIESSKLLASDPEIIHTLKKSHPDSGEFLKTIDKLNDIQASNLNITGLTLYGMNGVYYPANPSNNTANSTPDLQQILKDPVIRQFIRNDQKSLWFERFQRDYWITDLTLNLHLYSGVFTFIQKVYAPDSSLVGLLLTDIAMDSIYDHFQVGRLKAATFVYSSRRGILESPRGKSLTRPEIAEIMGRLNAKKIRYFITRDSQKVVFFHPIPHSFDGVIRVIPLTDILREINKLLWFLFLINALLIIGVIFLGLSMSKSISWPLGDLYAKMQKFTKI